MPLPLNLRTAAVACAIGLFALAPVTWAQTPSVPTNQDHGAHHPEAKPGDKPSEARPGGMGMNMMGHDGMSGSDMKPMMGMMQRMMAMMSAQGGMMGPHVEGRIATIKAELKITDDQLAAWNRFADALRASAKSTMALHQPMMMMQPAPSTTLPDALSRQVTLMATHVEALKAVTEALTPLYASFTPEQRKIADGLRVGPMGVM